MTNFLNRRNCVNLNIKIVKMIHPKQPLLMVKIEANVERNISAVTNHLDRPFSTAVHDVLSFPERHGVTKYKKTIVVAFARLDAPRKLPIRTSSRKLVASVGIPLGEK